MNKQNKRQEACKTDPWLCCSHWGRTCPCADAWTSTVCHPRSTRWSCCPSVSAPSSPEITMSLCCYCSSLFLCHHLQSECFCVVSGTLCVISWNLNVSVLLLVLSLSSPVIRMFLCCNWSSLCHHLQSECFCVVTGPPVCLCRHLQSECFCVVTGHLSLSSPAIRMFLCCYWSSLCCHVQSEYFCVVTGPLSVVTWNQNVSVLLLVLPLSSPAIRMFLCCYWSSLSHHLQSQCLHV